MRITKKKKKMHPLLVYQHLIENDQHLITIKKNH